MSIPEPSENVYNRILLSLKPEILEGLQPHLQSIRLERGDTIGKVDAPVRRVCFVNRGLVSIVKSMRDGRVVEVGAIGLEGTTNPGIVFGAKHAIIDTMVQIPGSAFCIEYDVLQGAMSRFPDLFAMMRGHMQFAISQLVQTSACNRLHSIDQRCCRWLLLASDNALSNTFPLTHEFLAMMLGVQRSGVSIVLGMLKRMGWVEYCHGKITITDRQGLEGRVCECYRDTQDEIDRLYGATQVTAATLQRTNKTP